MSNVSFRAAASCVALAIGSCTVWSCTGGGALSNISRVVQQQPGAVSLIRPKASADGDHIEQLSDAQLQADFSGFLQRSPLAQGRRFKRLNFGLNLESARSIRTQSIETANNINTCTDAQSKKWIGNTPPTCDNNGALRRVFTVPYIDVVESAVLLNQSTLVRSHNSAKYCDDGAYDYIEAWTGPNTNNAEAGVQYSPAKTAFTFYMKAGKNQYGLGPSQPAGSLQISQPYIILAGTSMLAQQLDTGAWVSCTSGCWIGHIAKVGSDGNRDCPAGYVCEDGYVSSLDGFVENCCIFAHVTSIAQPANNFTDGSNFASNWSGSASATCTIAELKGRVFVDECSSVCQVPNLL